MTLLLWTPQTFHLFSQWGIHVNMLYVDYCVYTVRRALYSTSPAHEAWHLGIWKLGADAPLQLLEARPVASSTAGGSQKSYSAWNMLSHFCTYNRIVFRSCHTKLLKPVFPYRTITTPAMSHSGTQCSFGFPFSLNWFTTHQNYSFTFRAVLESTTRWLLMSILLVWCNT